MSEAEAGEAWVKIPTPSERAAVKEQGDPYNFGFIPAMGGLLAAHPEFGAQFFGLYRQVMFAPEGVLSRGERELTAAVAAAAQDCFY